MKKYFVGLLGLTLLGTVSASAQADVDFSPANSKPQRNAFKVYNAPTTDKTDMFEIQSLGSTTFTASNVVDGSTNSYKHSLQITVGLVVANKGTNTSFQLNFYSPNDNIQQAASFTDGVLNIYYPVAVYEDLRTKLEQALAARKKVTIKVIQKTNGYREGTLVL